MNAKQVTTQRSVHIRVLGRLWMPMCLAANEKRYSLGDGHFQAHEVGTLDDVEDLMLQQTDDFSQIVDWEAVYLVTRSFPAPNGIGTVVHTRERIARRWENPDHEYDYMNCFPVDD